MCFGFLGIQIGFDLQGGNMSRIFQTLGAEMDSLAILWIAAPLTGLLIQPIVGYFSDKTWGRFGRRRPYFMIGAFVACLALFVMPNSPSLWIAAGVLWILDASLNITMEPTRAFVGDMLPERQRTTGYAMQSFFIGIGAVLAGALPWLLTQWGVENTAPEGQIPLTVHIAFYVGGAAMFLAVLVTVLTTKEYSPEQMEAFEKAQNPEVSFIDGVDLESSKGAQFFYKGGVIWAIVGAIISFLIFASRGDMRPDWLGDIEFGRDLYVLAGMIAGFGLVQLLTGFLTASQKTENGFVEVVNDLFDMPLAMRQLAVVQFFSWFAWFTMWIYGTPAVADFHFEAENAQSALYQEAGNWWALLGAVRNGVAAAAALGIIYLATKLDNRRLHAICMTCGAVGFAGLVLVKSPELLIVPMIGIGIAWASIVSVPYAMLASSVPSNKMGIYLGVFNIFIVVPQLLAATLLGFLLRTFFGNEPIWAFAIASVSFFCAAIAVMFVTVRANDEVIA